MNVCQLDDPVICTYDINLLTAPTCSRIFCEHIRWAIIGGASLSITRLSRAPQDVIREVQSRTDKPILSGNDRQSFRSMYRST